MRIILVTGMLSAGKSIALKALEDLGYYCIDNLPPNLIPMFLDLFKKSNSKFDRIAIASDVRGGVFFGELLNMCRYLKEEKNGEILFIDADDEVLIQRYKLSRRKHFLALDERIESTIQRERTSLAPIKAEASYVIDTSNTSVKEFKDMLNKRFGNNTMSEKIQVQVVSFGFKYGILKDANLVFDVRFLPNPYYIQSLKAFDGNHKEIVDYVTSFAQTHEFLDKLMHLLVFLIPYYQTEGKKQLVVGIGCSGGKHRSVAIANLISRMLKEQDFIVVTSHRDLGRE